MAKARVSALAKDIGKTSKELIEWLNANGEYVKTPSSTVEAPVVAKVLTAFPKIDKPADDGAAAPAKKTAAKKAAAAAAKEAASKEGTPRRAAGRGAAGAGADGRAGRTGRGRCARAARPAAGA